MEFAVKPLTTNSSSFLWDSKLRNEGNSITPIIPLNETNNFFNNFATVYDLSYNHLPKWSQNDKFKAKKTKFECIDNFVSLIK